ncbi:hypothetical protein M406DRAFT_325466 [Cryphonectria parasitica EP155]|uniref:Arrestin-like N-terminal domain-containing protein n=1 Tax=Cryphonectria parasitica (strain ATCC 38755 / EP155) TaxID=660469 RepID=A0A9P4YAF6_CRYP1|nr:uncharacterized protein M406DRAFT_325466 [Cryphonectria parasitica EP155]KAF3769989.1 hypothetical protein M406DRAFT_325466 [Cryphonectria parasitica EP155]
MRLVIKLDHEHENKMYTSLDVVTEFSLEARLPSSDTVTIGLEYNPTLLYHKVLYMSQVLFPIAPLSSSTRYTLGKGRHYFTFGIDLSLLSRCIDLAKLQSPVLEQAHRQTGCIFYVICATVKGCGSFRRAIRQRIGLTSVQVDSPNISSSARGPSKACRVLPETILGTEIPYELEVVDGFLPPYSPALVLGASVGGGGFLRVGDALPLSLWVTVPTAVSQKLKISLRSVRLSLMNITVVDKGGRREFTLTGTVIRQVFFNLSLETRPGAETTQIDPALWQGALVPSQPSPERFADEVDQENMLQVLCEFSSDKLSDTTFVTLLIPVHVAAAEPPPSYEVITDCTS